MALALEGISVLVVEDEKDTRELLKILLQAEGGVVTATASVQEALSAYDRSCPTVIVADIGMPDYNGYTLIGKVRARDLTAYATAMDRDTALSAGFQVHMSKPFDPDRLIAVIADLAAKFKQNNAG